MHIVQITHSKSANNIRLWADGVEIETGGIEGHGVRMLTCGVSAKVFRVLQDPKKWEQECRHILNNN